jgi:hypothetical protein
MHGWGKLYYEGGQLAYDAESKGLLPVYDMQICDYRNINLNTMYSLTINNTQYSVK